MAGLKQIVAQKSGCQHHCCSQDEGSHIVRDAGMEGAPKHLHHASDTSHAGKIANLTPFMAAEELGPPCSEGKSRRGKSCSSDCGSIHHGILPSLRNSRIQTDRALLGLEPAGQHQLAGGDLERGSGEKHVTLQVRGMTCSGCETKLINVLNTIGAVSSVNTSFVGSFAEFKLDTAAVSVQDVIRRVEHMTGFKTLEVRNEYQSIDLVVTAGRSREVALKNIGGLIDTISINKKTLRLTYDPHVIGIRTLLDMAYGGNYQLAPIATPGGVQDAKTQQKIMAAKTSLSLIFTIPVVVFAWSHTSIDERVVATVSLVLATLVQVVAGSEFYYDAWTTLRSNHSVDMDTLVALSVTAAYSYSIVAYAFLMSKHPLDIKAFFETSTLLASLVLLGRLISSYARIKAVAAISTRSLQNHTAITISKEQTMTEIDVRLLQFGDCFAVPPYARFPTDGVIIEGDSEVDESVITGEAMPIRRTINDKVIAGTMNGSGFLKVRLTRLPGSNTVTDIAGLVEHAISAKPRVQVLANSLARWFIPVVGVTAMAAFLIWLAVLLRIEGREAGSAVGTALTYAIAVLAVSCPCALVLAVPMVLVIAGGIAARSGVVVKSAEAMEQAWQITDVVFDKTGTLTLPELKVVEEHIIHEDADFARALTLALTSGNKHPVSLSVARHLSARQSPTSLSAQNIRIIPGSGVEGTISGVQARAGNASWLRCTHHPKVRDMTAAGRTVLCVTAASSLIAIYGLEGSLRPGATNVVHELLARGLTLHLISGDTAQAVQSCANSLGIPIEHVRWRCSPTAKQGYVLDLLCNSDRPRRDDEHDCQHLEHSGCDELHHSHHTHLTDHDPQGQHRHDPRRRRIMFVGDGTNDAVAMAASSVGVSIGTLATQDDVLSSAASVSLLSGNLEGLTVLLDISRAARNRIVFNFAWALVYNVVAVLLAAGAFVKVRVEPRWAGLGELVSVLPVIAGAGSLLLHGRRKGARVVSVATGDGGR